VFDTVTNWLIVQLATRNIGLSRAFNSKLFDYYQLIFSLETIIT